MIIFLLVLSILFVVSTIATWVKLDHWIIRAFDFPYIQFSLLGLAIIILWLINGVDEVEEIMLLTLNTGFFIYRLTVIYPYTPIRKPALLWNKTDEVSVKFLTANVLMTNTDYAGFLEVEKAADPDIFMLVEVSHEWSEYVEEHLAKKYEYRISHPIDNTYGIMMYSKLKLLDDEIQFLIDEEVPSIHCKIQMRTGELVQFFGLHPKPPAPGENKWSTPRDAELVLAGNMARDSDLPVIVAGDMNDVAWSHTTRLFMRISGLLDPRMGRGLFNTFHAQKKLLRWPLDHIFLSEHFQVRSIKKLNNFGSDHYPICLELVLKESQQAKEEIEYPDSEDLEEAEEKLESAT